MPGRELAVSVVMAKDPWALPLIEAVPLGRDFYDFEARYTPGETELRPPRDLADDIVRHELRPDGSWMRIGPADFADGDAQGRFYRWVRDRQSL